MDENPYQPPKELNSRPTARQGLAIGALVLLSIPFGFVCGGITCCAVDVASPPNFRESYFQWKSILIGLVVVVLVPVAVYFYGKLTDRRS